uniref:SET domain-containing protein n=1 Tax=Chromera velia CCMP2878 TaxID=1169474 RepID=A0A0G4GCL9_9ALVE|eukprot:Cvel_21312.t1-p1 / transcript=Cvel_21312.t1 / gene=Cvel_21312 / organism=Chromera_velia_CCMP2878 / gene_product=hypothetical protein / transcript_product=hypothetical protein / location=Cvel_scaffold1987:7221-10720(-) / protein_length=670 / sequence_SO=supercontig / SO=protein_coding / is_pseudo=false
MSSLLLCLCLSLAQCVFPVSSSATANAVKEQLCVLSKGRSFAFTSSHGCVRERKARLRRPDRSSDVPSPFPLRAGTFADGLEVPDNVIEFTKGLSVRATAKLREQLFEYPALKKLSGETYKLRGMGAVSDIKKDESLFQIMFDGVIRTDGAERNPMPSEFCSSSFWKNARWETRLAVQLLNEKRQTDSLFFQWINQLPKVGEMDTPIHWDGSELRELQSPYLASKVAEQQGNWTREYGDYVSAMEKDGMSAQFSEDEFVWAKEMARSRSVGVRKPRINFPLAWFTVFFFLLTSTIVQQDLVKVSEEFGRALVGVPTLMFVYLVFEFFYTSARDLKIRAMLPFLDFLNHDSKSANTVELQALQGAFILKAAEDVKRGQQVFLNYGQRSSDETLQYYGFVPEGGLEEDSAVVDFVRVLKSSKSALIGGGVETEKEDGGEKKEKKKKGKKDGKIAGMSPEFTDERMKKELEKWQEESADRSRFPPLVSPDGATVSASDLTRQLKILQSEGLLSALQEMAFGKKKEEPVLPGVMQVARFLVATETEASLGLRSFQKQLNPDNEWRALELLRRVALLDLYSKPTSLEIDKKLLKDPKLLPLPDSVSGSSGGAAGKREWGSPKERRERSFRRRQIACAYRLQKKRCLKAAAKALEGQLTSLGRELGVISSKTKVAA